MPNIGPVELIIILVIALLILGPGKLPDVGAAIGKSIREFRKATNEVQDSVTGSVTTPPPAAPAPIAAAVPVAPAPPAAVPAAPAPVVAAGAVAVAAPVAETLSEPAAVPSTLSTPAPAVDAPNPPQA
jgi:TatA/E family protein of Tat protein translocase